MELIFSYDKSIFMETLKDIFAPTARKLFLTLVVTFFAHIYITVSQFRQSASEDLSGIREFWLTNLVNGLPYLETESVVLKFLTFFAISYVLVWALSRTIEFSGGVRTTLAKKARKS